MWVTSRSDFDLDCSRCLANLSVDVVALISLWHTEYVVAVSVSSHREHTKRIDLLMEPFEETLMEKYRPSELGNLSEKVALGQNPPT